MQEVLKYFKDIRFWIPVAFLILFELFMQSGLYKNLLKPQSYADNVNRIMTKLKASKLKPNMLILGTSVAYQGINPRHMNKVLKDHWLIAQSGASQGARLATQHIIYRNIKKHMPELKVVVLVADINFPWQTRYGLDKPNRSMAAIIDRKSALEIFDDYDHRLTFQDKLFFYFKTFSYQKDLRNMFLKPDVRLKDLRRRWSEPYSDYVYINTQKYKISVFSKDDLDECVKHASGDMPGYVKKGEKWYDKNGVDVTDRHHRGAGVSTCHLGRFEPMDFPGRAQWEQLYFKRLALLHDEIHKDGREVITVFPPYSTLIQDLNADHRVNKWMKYFNEMYKGKPFYTLDLRSRLDGPGNGDYYYDTIHMNGPGAKVYTKILAGELKKIVELPGFMPTQAPATTPATNN